MIFNSSIFVAFVICCLTTFCQLVTLNKINLNVLVFTFVSSHLFYGTKSIAFKKLKINFYFFCFVLFFLLGFLKFLDFTFKLKMFYGFLICISYLYRFKILNTSLRTIPFLKPFVISFVISGFAVISNFFLIKNGFKLNLIFPFYASIFFFLVGIATISDLKDVETDTKQKLKTFANQLSLTSLKYLVFFYFTISLGLILAVNSIDFTFKQPLICTLFISLILVLLLKKQTNNLYFNLLIDGCLALPLLFYLIFW